MEREYLSCPVISCNDVARRVGRRFAVVLGFWSRKDRGSINCGPAVPAGCELVLNLFTTFSANPHYDLRQNDLTKLKTG